jgi:hypothetical protein
MNKSLNHDIASVFNGFLGLSMKEKVQLVDVLNEFFDYPDKREDMRRANEELVAASTSDSPCKCCRK